MIRRLSILFLAVGISACPVDYWLADIVPESPTVAGALPPPFQPAPACNTAGWCWERPGIPGHDFNDIDARDGAVWTAGDAGYVARFDGEHWAAGTLDGIDVTQVFAVNLDDVFFVGHLPGLFSTDSPPKVVRVRDGLVEAVFVDGAPPTQIFGSSAADIWAIGPNGVYQLDDDTWVLSRSTDPSNSRGFARAPDDVYVSSGGDNPDLIHFDGASWSSVWPPPGAPAGTAPPKSGAVAADGSSVFFCLAEGSDGTDHFARVADDGWTFWTVQALGPLRNIAAASRNDAVATGYVTLELRSGTWSEVPAPQDDLGGLRATYLDDAPFIATGGGSVMSRSDGQWTATLGLDDVRHVSVVTESPDGTIWAGSDRTALLRRDSGGWAALPNDALGYVTGIVARADNDVWAGTTFGLFHFDGTSWSEAPLNQLHPYGVSLVVDRSGTLWAGACGLWKLDDVTNEFVEVAVDGSVVAPDEDYGCPVRVGDLIVGEDDELFVVHSPRTADDVLFLLSAGVWSSVWPEDVANPGNNVQAASFDGTRLWVLNRAGRAFFEDGASFVNAAPLPPQPRDLPASGLRAFDSGYVFAFGRGGYLVEHRDGVWLPPEDTGTRNEIRSVWRSANGDLTAVGASGLVMRKQGS